MATDLKQLEHVLHGDDVQYLHLFPHRDCVPAIETNPLLDVMSRGVDVDEFLVRLMLDRQYIGWTTHQSVAKMIRSPGVTRRWQHGHSLVMVAIHERHPLSLLHHATPHIRNEAECDGLDDVRSPRLPEVTCGRAWLGGIEA
ncbi:MAG: hypothetical protein GY842_24900 [bacterium]|nr:hypothetical protein [bacterium]